MAVVQDGVSLKTRKEGLLGLGGACVSLFLYVYIVYIYIFIFTPMKMNLYHESTRFVPVRATI